MRDYLRCKSAGLIYLIAAVGFIAPAAVKAQAPCQVTPGIHEIKMPNGDSTFYGRLPMDFPEGNTTEHSVRQIRIHLPLMLNDTSTPHSTLQVPLVQATIEVNGIGAGNAMLIYGIERFEENGCATLLIDAQTPQGQQSQLPYFINITVIGTPLLTPKK